MFDVIVNAFPFYGSFLGLRGKAIVGVTERCKIMEKAASKVELIVMIPEGIFCRPVNSVASLFDDTTGEVDIVAPDL
jgi:hypothetical protein